ncbi:class I adenylate-forming enzyme family protein [Paenibacillus borealis]|uniref:AMP-dependent synthetase/ligase domain-containing protein n=1 Tax=Paenibacillus borealis TaxID=160799 RepID=A0A089LA53_PAEBO|nr:class I adenylate-forming enzyme family protein [Paenibacillus borealis]AIQ56955.1 hypothetical protein PBOR_08445 [Paenibacillus borealis]
MSLYSEMLIQRVLKNQFCRIQDNNRNISYTELYEEIFRLAAIFNEMGITKGTKVVLVFDNCIEFLSSIIALNSIEAVAIPVYFNLGISKLEEINDDLNINFLLTNSSRLCNELLKNEFEYKHRFYCTSSEIDILEKRRGSFSDDDEMEDVALILLTSGTISRPKGVMLTNANVIASINNISGFLNLNELDKLLIIKNPVHISTLVGELFVGIYNQCSFFLSNKLLTPRYFSEKITNENISVVFATPTILNDIMKSNIEINGHSLRMIHFSGEIIKFHTILEIMRHFSGVTLIQGYGLTEAAPRITQISTEDMLSKENSVGKPIGDQLVSIIDDNGEKCKPFTIGEVLVKGSNIMKGYYKNNKGLIKDWLHTDDLGYVDHEGYLYIVGRKDNMIIMNGRNIYPEEIESALLSYDGIKEALVELIETEDKRYIQASVTVHKTISVIEIIRFCTKHLEDYKIPHTIKIVEKITKTYSGKLLRRSADEKRS